jgi:hypothetical protein
MVAAALLAAVAVPVSGRAEEPPEFSGPRAFAHLETISAMGPRPSGSAAMVKQRALLAAEVHLNQQFASQCAPTIGWITLWAEWLHCGAHAPRDIAPKERIGAPPGAD